MSKLKNIKIVSLILIVAYVLLSKSELLNDDAFFICIYLLSIGVATALLSTLTFKHFVRGLGLGAILTFIVFLVAFITIPTIEDYLYKIPHEGNLLKGAALGLRYIFAPMLISNLITYTVTFILLRFSLNLNNKL
ncbi:hypothetical protein EHE19_007125 [Ruminiclostridium herbifermentans]|uniref:Uncharacterized protein n=1 Tax=Ruminiclostridium herbifermentans TaxID=2488810 RepID=A0A4U7JNY6_9FIRM|nr:hypothetical protein [Ruminiclostridium herbifermentans]QNU68186.1 hypothetical protein EHE19_007125 [Ruminiclostridium herbifermentans]